MYKDNNSMLKCQIQMLKTVREFYENVIETELSPRELEVRDHFYQECQKVVYGEN